MALFRPHRVTSGKRRQAKLLRAVKSRLELARGGGSPLFHCIYARFQGEFTYLGREQGLGGDPPPFDTSQGFQIRLFSGDHMPWASLECPIDIPGPDGLQTDMKSNRTDLFKDFKLRDGSLSHAAV